MRIHLLSFLGLSVLFLALTGYSDGKQHTHKDIITQDAPDTPRVPNLIDVLASLPEHTIFVRLLQRTRLLPTLMNLIEFGDGRGLTIMAPTDDAISKKAKMERERRLASRDFTPEYTDDLYQPQSAWEWAIYLAERDESTSDVDLIVPLWTDQDSHLDNVNAVLRQQILYHMINYTLPYNFTTGGLINTRSAPSLPSPGEAIMLTTLHRPSRSTLDTPTRPGPIPHPPTSPPHPGAEDGGGLLAGEGQKVRIAMTEEGSVKIGTNSKGLGGITVVNANYSSNSGVILSVDGILDLPPSFATILRDYPSLQYLRNLTTNSLLNSLTETAHTTFFLPTETAFETLTAVEKVFITGDWDLARQDRLRLLGEHMSGIGLGEGRIGYANQIREIGKVQMTTIFGGQVQVESDSEGTLLVAKARVVEEDVLIENGVIHIIDNLLLPFGDLGLSVEKTLLALNASRFVSLVHMAGLESYINVDPHDNDDPDHRVQPWTFMVPRDDAIDTWWKEQLENELYHRTKWGSFDAQEEGLTPTIANGTKLVEILKYHITPDQLSPANLSDGMLLGTELRDWKLKDARQKIIVVVEEGDDTMGGTNRQGNGDVGFDDANVIATPVKVGPSIIYLISKMLQPPANPLQTAVSSLSLSTFVAAVFSAELDKGIKRAPAITYLVPRNEAFSTLGLAMPYLLLDQTVPRSELRSVMEYHAIDRIVYMEDFATGSSRYPTLEGSPIRAGKNVNGTVEVRRGTMGRNARVLKGDMLTSTGVLHEIDQVELPPTLDLTIEKLLKGAKAGTMKDLIQLAGYGWILNASTPTYEQQMDFLGAESKFPDGRKHKKAEKRHRKRHELFKNGKQSYIVLCPTDAAFTRVNLTYYYENMPALKALVQLHIIPAPADQILPDGYSPQLPLNIKDTSQFFTLLDSTVGGISSFGKLAFRRVKVEEDGDSLSFRTKEERGLGLVVGVADTRGTDGRKYSANVLSFGRESLSIKRSHLLDQTRSGDIGTDSEVREGRLTNSKGVGGVLTIDGVLQPYEPNWFYRWGWIALSSFLVGAVLAGIGVAAWSWWHKDARIRLPEALEGEEE
ncbi:hypothetical protein CBS101457_004349 [Exobasidium rhododendri]|nr:hypothetical protein CBS101457_004349 [Exobasidium rhododendri]